MPSNEACTALACLSRGECESRDPAGYGFMIRAREPVINLEDTVSHPGPSAISIMGADRLPVALTTEAHVKPDEEGSSGRWRRPS